MRALLSFYLLAATLSVVPASAQYTALVLVIDGSKNPEQISDDLALQHLLLATMVSAHATPTERGRQEAQFASIGFGPSDTSMFVNELVQMRQQLDTIERASATRGSVAFLTTRPQQIAVVSESMAKIRRQLSADGLLRLNRYIGESVKKRIVVYGNPQ